MKIHLNLQRVHQYRPNVYSEVYTLLSIKKKRVGGGMESGEWNSSISDSYKT